MTSGNNCVIATYQKVKNPEIYIQWLCMKSFLVMQGYFIWQHSKLLYVSGRKSASLPITSKYGESWILKVYEWWPMISCTFSMLHSYYDWILNCISEAVPNSCMNLFLTRIYIITTKQLIYLENNKVTRMVTCIYTIMAEVLRRNIYDTVNVVFGHVPPLQFGAKDEDHCSTQTNVIYL